MAERKARIPAAWIFTDDFFGSPRVAGMNGLEQGLYALMLLREHQLQGQGLPADPERLQRLLNLTPKHWREYSPGVLLFFEEHEGRLFNDRMEAEIARARKATVTATEKGRQGAARRWRADASSNGTGDSPATAPATAPATDQAIVRATPGLMPGQWHPHPQPQPHPPLPPPPGGEMGGALAAPKDGRSQVLERLRGEFHFSADEAERIQDTLQTSVTDLDQWRLALDLLPKRAPKVQNRLAYVKDLMRTHRHARDAGLTWIDEVLKARDPKEKRRRGLLDQLRRKWSEGLWQFTQDGVAWLIHADGLQCLETGSFKLYQSMFPAELERILTEAVRERPATQEEKSEALAQFKRTLGGGGASTS